MGSSISSLPGNGCHCGLTFPWPCSASVSSALLASSFEAHLGSPPQERLLGLFLGCDHPCVTLPGQRPFYMESGPRTKFLALCKTEQACALSQHSKEPGWFQFLSVLTLPPIQAPSGLRFGPGSIGLYTSASFLWRGFPSSQGS